MHQLGSGLYVSGPSPGPAKEKNPSPAPAPYTGGDVSKSGDLGRMFEIPSSSSSPRSHPSRPHSGHLHRPSPLSQLRHSGLLVGPVHESESESARKEKSTTSIEDAEFVFGVPLYCYLVVVVMVGAGVGVGVFVFVVLRQIGILMVAAVVLGVGFGIGVWNWWRKETEMERFFRSYPDTCFDRSNLPVGELVKISGQVTCGHLPLRTSYQDFSRCIFTSTELYEYRGWSDLPANPNHRRLTWGLRHSERHVANFYISDSTSGIRFFVRAGDGAKVTSFVKSKTIDISKEKRELSPNFVTWLADHNLPSDDRIMRLKEGFVKEGDTASVIGILKRHQLDNMIDPPSGVVTTGCQWKRCLFPVLIEGLILIGNETPDEVVYVV
ncbi:uncharacterized membrane protein At1g16860-like [Typha angustifolia]|uniref:uncharacterized membrane protein At1g16860-like n=1 Tax=Typha angustifolia TaxID=59011 RepID=UPI003C30B564